MSRSSAAGLAIVVGVLVMGLALAARAIALEPPGWTTAAAFVGIGAIALGASILRREIAALARGRRFEIAAFTAGVLGVIVLLGYFSARFSLRIDLTEAGLHSLSPQAEAMLGSLDRPVRVTFFHDRLMRETVELYELMAGHSDHLTVEFHDPTLNPAKARMLGVAFAGTSVMESGDQRLHVNGSSEADIANALLRVTRAAKQRVCFLTGHNEADPFSMESHDHREGSAGADHSHGLGAQYVLHDRHGLAKARHGLETLNYEVESLTLTQAHDRLSACALLVVAGPKTRLLDTEVEAIRRYLREGGNGFFMLDPTVDTGLDPVLLEYGIRVDDTLVIDPSSHYWTDVSAPAVTRYNNHRITRDLPLTFFPGARSLSPTEVPIPATSVSPVVNSSPASFAKRDRNDAQFVPTVDRKGPVTLMAISSRRVLRDGDFTVVRLGEDAERGEARLRELVGDAPEQVRAPSRIAVIGDADFATNSFFHFLGNGNLFLNAVSYLVGKEDLIGIEPRTRDLPELSVTNRQLKGTFLLSMLLVPALLATIGTVVWWQQR